MIRVLWLALALLPPALSVALAAGAETAWVKDELRLNLRTGPGTEYRIKGAVGTGDRLEVLERTTGWTKVSSPDLGEGWIPEGFLQAEPTAGVRLAQTEAETADFRSQFDSISKRAKELEQTNATLSERDTDQQSQIQKLTRENLELRAGARWPEWITGAGILTAGMLMGVILHSIVGRRTRPRIRL